MTLARRKPTKTTLTRKLDKLCSEVVRSRGACARCKKTETLQAAHIFSRVYRATRWDLDNILCLCAACHWWAHLNPILFADWLREYLGEEKYAMLKEARNQIARYTLEDLQTKLEVLESMREGR